MEVISVRRHPLAGALPALAAALMPKCPLCFIALAGALGVEGRVLARWAGPAATALVAISIAIVGFAAIRRGQRVALLLLAIAAILLGVETETNSIRHLEGLLVIAAALLTSLAPRHQCHMKGTAQ